MQITRTGIAMRSQPLKRPVASTEPSNFNPSTGDSVTFSSSNALSRLGKGVGGTVAGTLFSGLLFSLPLSLAPAMGAEVRTAVGVYTGVVAACGLAGGLASAAMPPGKDWY